MADFGIGALGAHGNAAPGADADILDAWQRRSAAYDEIDRHRFSRRDEAAEPYWAIIDDADRVIHGATAKSPLGVEVQIWTALHKSNAYLGDDERAVLMRDLEYVERHKARFDWDVLPIIAAIRSLRAMEA